MPSLRPEPGTIYLVNSIGKATNDEPVEDDQLILGCYYNKIEAFRHTKAELDKLEVAYGNLYNTYTGTKLTRWVWKVPTGRDYRIKIEESEHKDDADNIKTYGVEVREQRCMQKFIPGDHRIDSERTEGDDRIMVTHGSDYKETVAREPCDLQEALKDLLDPSPNLFFEARNHPDGTVQDAEKFRQAADLIIQRASAFSRDLAASVKPHHQSTRP